LLFEPPPCEPLLVLRMYVMVDFPSSVFLILSALGFVKTASAFLPLGSDPPSSCTIGNYECPSHYICSNSKCMCDRYYGFYGSDCEKLSAASYFYSIIYLLTWPIMAFGFVYNLYLLRLLYKYGKLNCGVSVTLMLNMIASLLPCELILELPFTVFGLDKQMFMRQYLRAPFMILIFFSSMLSSFKISESWIRLTLKGSKKGRKNNVLRNYYVYLGIGCFAFIVLVIFCFIVYRALEILTAATPLLIAVSYWYGGKLVVKTLRSMYRPGTKLSGVIVNALELANAVEITARTIALFSVLGTLSTILTAVTFHSKTPYYPQQSHLPRWIQGQIAVIMVRRHLSCIHYVCLFCFCVIAAPFPHTLCALTYTF
jgi:hypothetical protein